MSLFRPDLCIYHYGIMREFDILKFAVHAVDVTYSDIIHGWFPSAQIFAGFDVPWRTIFVFGHEDRRIFLCGSVTSTKHDKPRYQTRRAYFPRVLLLNAFIASHNLSVLKMDNDEDFNQILRFSDPY